MATNVMTLKRRWIRAVITTGLTVGTVATVSAAPFELEWRTVDGGGRMFSTGGAYSLGGTIGQHDAGSFSSPMSGGAYSLVGGFWPGAGDCWAMPVNAPLISRAVSRNFISSPTS